MTSTAQLIDVLDSSEALSRIVNAVERTADAYEEFLAIAKRPKPLFADYDAGVRHAQKEHAALVRLLREIADDSHTPTYIVRRINNALGE